MEPPERQSILNMNCDEARAFFLKHETYSDIDLPPYFGFDQVLKKVSKILKKIPLSELSVSPREFENVNHSLLNNKDGRYAWRPLQLIHPALYVELVNILTEEDNWDTILARFKFFRKHGSIHCISLPGESLTDENDKAAQITHWWQEMEQRSFEVALDYEFIVHADIADCYGAIYTHSIAWALHGKGTAKTKRHDKKLIGNRIDKSLQDMHHGQTNGIPQGSVLMDFIAEILLGYADSKLGRQLKRDGVGDFLLLRYRDDYRIFVNNSADGERVLKRLTEVLIGLGLKLNAKKTKASAEVIRESIKTDKLAWMRVPQPKSLQKQLLLIHDHGTHFPNTGSVTVALSKFYRRLTKTGRNYDPLPLISIVVDIAFRNPRTYPVCAAILSLFLDQLETDEQRAEIATRILRRFSQLPNTGHMEVWLQRATLGFSPTIEFGEALCRLAKGRKVSVWNNEWI